VTVGAPVLGERVAEQLGASASPRWGLRSALEIFAVPPRTTTPSPRSLKTWGDSGVEFLASVVR